jgi:hypothetical protein
MIYYLLHRHKWRKVMPRSRHEKKAGEEALEAYKKITETIKTLKKSQPKLRVMFQDEAGFGRINKPKRCWCKKEIRPCVPCHHIRKYRYLYGAVSPQDGELFSLVMPYANTDCMNIFLEELSKAYPDDYILLLLDNAAWHCSSTMVAPSRIELFPLPSYTPELNPIEMIWDELREKGFRNEIFKNLEAVIDRLRLTVKELAEDVQRVDSITHRSRLIDVLTFWSGIRNDLIRVVSSVSKQRFSGQPIYQVDSFFIVSSGTFCNKNSDWHTMRIHGQMYFGVEPPFVRDIS